LITDIAKEEMLHMLIVANILNAIGGHPQITRSGFVPTYPGPLPMSIGAGLQVGLKKFSKELVHDVFMKIEEPEKPIVFLATAAMAAPQYATIGEFYRAVIAKIKELGEAIFVGDVSRQVTNVPAFSSSQLFAITNVDTATRALELIVTEGEGTTTLPFGDKGEFAHYYRFEEIYRGRQLVKAPAAPNGYAYTGDAIPFDPAGVWDFPDNPKAADYPLESDQRRKVDRFNRAYSDMLRLLQQTLDGTPEQLEAFLQSMILIRIIAASVVATTDPNTGRQLGLTFEYVTPA
jgi:Ferritin-like